MTTLVQLHALVAKQMNKGSSLDNIIPDIVRLQARMMEQNYTFNYMKVFQELTLAANCRGFVLPAAVKEVYFLRTVPENAEFGYLNHVDPIQVSQLSTDEDPVGWWLSGKDKIFFDAVLSEETNMEIYYARYTTWPTDYNVSLDIIDWCENALMLHSVMALMPYTRNPEGFQMYSQLLKDALTTLTGAEMEKEIGGASLQMAYE